MRLVVVFVAIAGCSSPNANWAPTPPDLAQLGQERPAIAAPALTYVVERGELGHQADLAGATAGDLARARDLAELPDLAPPACSVQRGGTCVADTDCCPGTITGLISSQVDPSSLTAYCNMPGNTCCTMVNDYANCPPGHYQIATNCGAGWTTGFCN